jgi:hypothetical protein
MISGSLGKNMSSAIEKAAGSPLSDSSRLAVTMLMSEKFFNAEGKFDQNAFSTALTAINNIAASDSVPGANISSMQKTYEFVTGSEMSEVQAAFMIADVFADKTGKFDSAQFERV